MAFEPYLAREHAEPAVVVSTPNQVEQQRISEEVHGNNAGTGLRNSFNRTQETATTTTFDKLSFSEMGQVVDSIFLRKQMHHTKIRLCKPFLELSQGKSASFSPAKIQIVRNGGA